MWNSRLSLPILCALLLICSAPALALEPVALQLKWSHQWQFAGYYAALEKGFYAEVGLDVEIRERTLASHIDQVLSGEAHYGISDSSLVLHRLQGRPVVALAAILQHSPMVLITRAEDGILGPRELVGRRVMRQAGVDDAALTAMFHSSGVDPKELIDVPHTLDDAALLRGEVDAISAYLTNQPYYFEDQGLDIHVINPLNYGIDFYGDILFTSEREMRSNPDRAMRFRTASLRGWHYALQNKAEIAALLVDKYGVQRSLRRLMQEADAVERMIAPRLVEIGHLNTDRFKWIANIYRAEGMAPDEVLLDGIHYRDHLKQPVDLHNWIMGLVTGTGVALLGLLISYAVNRRLKARVADSTRELRAARDALQSYLAIVDRYVITSNTDKDGVITYVSEAFCRISQYPREDLLGRTHQVIRHPEAAHSVFSRLWLAISAGKSWHGEIRNQAKDGSTFWLDTHIDPLFNPDGSISGYSAVHQDITARKLIEKISVTDKLTGLYNRHRLDEALRYEILRYRRKNMALSLILFDVDRFKAINDNHGHEVGDVVLREIALIARRQLRNTDIFGRWGGEEYLIICPDCTASNAGTIAEKIRQAIASHLFRKVGRVTVSFGVAEIGNAEDIIGLIRRADQAMYQAKDLGRNRVIIGPAEALSTDPVGTSDGQEQPNTVGERPKS